MLDPNPNEGAPAGGDYTNTSEADEVTATVTSAAREAPTVTEFMSAVVPWPRTPQDPGWIVMPNGYVSKAPGGRLPTGKFPIGPGKPFKAVEPFVGYATWALRQNYIKDLFFVLSLQRDVDKTSKGKLKGKKSAAAALAVKAIWLDVDVSKEGAYATVKEALKAAIKFSETVGLPPFSAIVGSGGGVHLYWISDRALTPTEWRPYAEGLKAAAVQHGLKCDHGVTTDIARMLRVPGTFNHKLETSRPCKLFNVPLVVYDFPTQLASLAQITPLSSATTRKSVSSATAYTPFAEEADLDSFRQPPEFAAPPNDTLQAGIDKFADVQLDPRPIFMECGFYRQALANGGKDYDQQLWMYSVLGATFMQNGNAIAHKISKDHATYTPADTNAMFDRKLAERHDRRLGYPSCAAIAGANCKACQTCPLLAKGKSPLNIRPIVTATVNSASASQAEPSFVDPYAEFVGPEFPLAILPSTLANFVDAEHRATGADPSAIAMAALTAAAGAIHADTQVRVGDGWWEKPILWTCLVGQPSSMKSPIIEKATKPLSRIDYERDKRWRQEQANWAQNPNKKTIPSPPKPARCVINDATAEKVAEVLSRDPSGSLMVHDELAGWMGGFERYNTGQSPRAFYLTGWNGGTFLKDRVGKGKGDPDAEVRVENLALCILGGIQPDRLTKLGDLTSDGLLQRFLTVLMKSAKLGDPDYRVAGAEAEYEKLIRSINDLAAQNYHFADEAFEIRDDVLGHLHKLELVDGFPPSLIGAIGKLKGYFSRICLVLHILEQHDAKMGEAAQSEPLPPSFTTDTDEDLRQLFGLLPDDCLSVGIAVGSAISPGTAKAAKKMTLEFLLPHMIGLYDVVVNGGQEREKLQSIANFILASDKDRLRPSDFTAGVRALRGEPEQKIREWAGRFCSMDWLRPEDDKPGVPARAWLVSSGLRDYFIVRLVGYLSVRKIFSSFQLPRSTFSSDISDTSHQNCQNGK